MNTVSPPAAVLDEVATWPGITTPPTPRGATAIVFDGHELGHVHPDRKTLDLPLPDDLRAQVLEAGRAKEWFSTWVSKPLTDDEDAQDGLALLRGRYDALSDDRGLEPATPGHLPERRGPRSHTTPATPHVQLDQPSPGPLQDELWRRMASLEGVVPGRSGISAPSSRALHLDPVVARGPREAYLVGTEFAHLHGDGSGSLHLALPRDRGAEAVARGWGEVHPAARAGIAPPTLVMLYGPRDEDELAVVWQLVEESYAYAREGEANSSGTSRRIDATTTRG